MDNERVKELLKPRIKNMVRAEAAIVQIMVEVNDPDTGLNINSELNRNMASGAILLQTAIKKFVEAINEEDFRLEVVNTRSQIFERKYIEE